MRGGIDEGAFIVLAVDFDQRGAKRTQHLDADRLIVDEGTGPAVGKLHAAQNELVLTAQAVVGKKRARGMALADFKSGRDLTLLGGLAHQGDIAARAERKRKSIKQYRLAGAGFAGQHRETGTEIDVQPVDQDDVADGKPGEHGDRTSDDGCRRKDDWMQQSKMIFAILSLVPPSSPLTPVHRHPFCEVASPIFWKARLIQAPFFSMVGSPPAVFTSR